jgi:hypothetical protein
MRFHPPALVVCSCALLLFLAPASAQQGSLLFGTQFTEAALSGVGGTQPMPGLQSAVIDNQGVSIVVPSAAMPNAYEIVNFGGLAAYYGDTNSNGTHVESTDVGTNIDAIWVPRSISSPANWCDFFFSTGSDVGGGGTGGILGGTPVFETEMILLQLSSAPPLKLYSEAQLEVLLGMAPGSLASADVDAFTKDNTTGDMFFSFTDTVTINGTTPALDGDIIVVPGAAYTPVGPYGVVTAPIAGLAYVGATEASLAAIITGLGVVLPANRELSSIDLDPRGGTFGAPPVTIPNMIFTFETSGATSGPRAPSVYTTFGGGAFFTINGVTLNVAPAVGLNPTSFNPMFTCGSLDALDFVAAASRHPLTIDRFPNSVIPTPGLVAFDIAGIAPGSSAQIVVNSGPAGPGTASFRQFIPGLTGHCELYVNFADPIFACFFFGGCAPLLAPNPVPISTLPDYGAFALTVPLPLPAGFTLTFQALDLTTLALSPGNEIRF